MNYLPFPRLNDYLLYWSRKTPGKAAMIQAEDGRTISYRRFRRLVDLLALKLTNMGIGKGDRVATLMVLVPEHIMLLYACFKIGAVVSPLDLRLKDAEVVRDINRLGARALFFLGKTLVRDFRAVARVVQRECPSVKHLVQFTTDPKPKDLLEGAISGKEMMIRKRLLLLHIKELLTRRLKKNYRSLSPGTPALLLYTNGITGPPKPALLSHENILVQNEILARGMEMTGGQNLRMLIHLPPSHVACLTEAFMTTLFLGGTAVFLRTFDPKQTLHAISDYQISALLQSPSQFRMLWKDPDYERTDLSHLRFAIVTGEGVDAPFIQELSSMAPHYGTGLAVTETAGFATFTPLHIPPGEMAGQVGRAFPDLAPVSVRKPMEPDGRAGVEQEDGELGEICCHPPLAFLGYDRMPEETARTLARDGILYTGDLGYFKDMGTYRALFVLGRRKFTIRQNGEMVFPEVLEAHIAKLEGVDAVEVIGMEHRGFGEGIVAFVRPKRGVGLRPEKVMSYCWETIPDKIPQHVVIWPGDREFPLTRTSRADKTALKELARPIIEDLRLMGQWDQDLEQFVLTPTDASL